MEVLHHSSVGWWTWSPTRWFVARSHNVRCLIIEENARIYMGCWNFFFSIVLFVFAIVVDFFPSPSSASPYSVLLVLLEEKNSVENFVDNRKTKKIREI
jgi:hypothetical protein